MDIMSPYDCPICGTKLKVNSPQVIGVHERGKVHQAALQKKTDELNEHKLSGTDEIKQAVTVKPAAPKIQKTVKAPIPPIQEYVPPVISIQTTKPEEPKNVKDTKTKTEQKSEEWDGEFF